MISPFCRVIPKNLRQKCDLLSQKSNALTQTRLRPWLWLGLLAALLINNQAIALEWTFTPTFSAQETYTDNVNLDSGGNEKSAFVTEISPGVSVRNQSPRSSLNFNYRLNATYNADGEGGSEFNNQLQYDSSYIVLKNRLFIDSNSTISQRSISNDRIANDNISGSDNNTTVITSQISPFWTPHFGGYADGELRLSYNTVSIDDDSASDTTVVEESINLRSGSKFTTFRWTANFNNSESSRSDGDDVSFQNSNATLRWLVNNELSITATAGHSSNDFSSSSNSSNNGIFYTVGGQWRPSQRFSINAGVGNNSFVTVFISPFDRLTWITTYRNRDIGTNTGDTWETEFNYFTRRSSWQASYNEDTTTTQTLLLQEPVFPDNDNNNEPLPNPIDLPTLTDEVFVRKRGDLNFTFTTGKSNINFNVFSERRTFEDSSDKDDVIGASVSWGWQIASRTNTQVSALWQSTESEDFQFDRMNFIVGLTRSFTSRLSGRVEYRFLDQTSDQRGDEFQENRITASVSVRFN